MDEVRKAVVSLLPRRPTQTDYRKLAEALEAEAVRLRRLADAQQRNPGVASKLTSPRGGRPRGSGARFIRVEEPVLGGTNRRSGRIYLGKSLWQEIGEPDRVDIQRLGSELWIRPAERAAGFSVLLPKGGMPRVNIGQETLDSLRLAEGRYEADIRDGAIVAVA